MSCFVLLGKLHRQSLLLQELQLAQPAKGQKELLSVDMPSLLEEKGLKILFPLHARPPAAAVLPLGPPSALCCLLQVRELATRQRWERAGGTQVFTWHRTLRDTIHLHVPSACSLAWPPCLQFRATRVARAPGHNPA